MNIIRVGDRTEVMTEAFFNAKVEFLHLAGPLLVGHGDSLSK